MYEVQFVRNKSKHVKYVDVSNFFCLYLANCHESLDDSLGTKVKSLLKLSDFVMATRCTLLAKLVYISVKFLFPIFGARRASES